MCTSIRSGRSGRSGRERSYQTDQTDQTDSEPRRSRPRIRARPAGLQIGIHVGRGFPLRLERLLQAEERPAVVRMLLEIDLVHLLCVGGPLGFEERGAQPVACRERQWLRLVVLELVIQRGGALECSDRCGQVAGCAYDLAVEDVGEYAEQPLRGMIAELDLRGVRR